MTRISLVACQGVCVVKASNKTVVKAMTFMLKRYVSTSTQTQQSIYVANQSFKRLHQLQAFLWWHRWLKAHKNAVVNHLVQTLFGRGVKDMHFGGVKAHRQLLAQGQFARPGHAQSELAVGGVYQYVALGTGGL